MKSLSRVTLALLTASSLFLAACNKEDTAPKAPAANTAAPAASEAAKPAVAAPEAEKQVSYLGNFDSTAAFYQRYTTAGFDFNATLPLRLNYVSLLNLLSNGAFNLQQTEDAKFAAFQVKSVLVALYKQFNAINEGYQKEAAQDAAKVKDLFAKEGLTFDLNNASLPALLGQLSSACEKTNNFKVNQEKLVADLRAKLENQEYTLRDAEVKEISNWENNFAGACKITKELYKVTQEPGFSVAKVEEELKNYNLEQAKAKAAAEQAAEPAKEEAPATTPAETKPTEEKK